MQAERWQQLDQLFNAALALEPAERSAFLAQACSDESLRNEVEALLDGHERAGNFMNRAALEIEAQSLAEEKVESVVGQTIGQYTILSSLGVGGMGEVYLAEDGKLGRKIALKLLPAAFTQDEDRVRRFQQEARAASALNHPNIITIYEIGQIEDRHFIATEFIDGENLRQIISTSGVRPASTPQTKVNEILNVSIQIADALAAAHEAGIVHRDIKPENIMVRRRDRYVKVLDFGLAKLSERIGEIDSEGPTRAQVKTSAGMVMGTVGYMSPEQARGEQMDARTDLWSLGVVLYEMVAGCAPFERSTPSEVIASILEHEPVPLPRYSRDVPAELERIVTKTLTKNRDERYQTAKDLLVDLRRLKQRIELDAEIARTSRAENDRPKISTEPIDVTRSTEPTGRRSGKRRRVPIVLISLLAVSFLAVALYKFRPSITKENSTKLNDSSAPFIATKMSRLTNTGKVRDAVISPDGKVVVHLFDDGERPSIRMQQVSSPSTELVINAPTDLFYLGLSFSPDGNNLYLIASDRKNPNSLYRMSMLGGAATKLVTDIDSPVTFSPDNKQFAYMRGNPLQGELGLFTANVDGTSERKIVSLKIPARVTMTSPGWSPDGKKIVYPVDTIDDKDTYVTLAEVPPEGGPQRRITSAKWFRVNQLNWLPDGSGLVLIGREQLASPAQIWFLSYPEGKARRITNDLKDYLNVSLTADADELVTVESEPVSNLWVVSGTNAASARQITTNRSDGIEGISWTSDNKIIYASRGTEKMDLWSIDPDGTNKKQLTIDSGNNKRPSVSPDGRFVVFVSDRTGNDHVWRMDIDGGNPIQLTNGIGEKNPQCSPDGSWVVYQLAFGKTGVWIAPTSGGEPKHLVDQPTRGISVSPDGNQIATSYFLRDAIKTVIYSFEGKPEKILDISTNYLRWTLDGKALTYIDFRDSQSIIKSQSIDGGPVSNIIDLSPDRIFYFAWSRDQQSLALARGEVVQDVVLIRSLKGNK